VCVYRDLAATCPACCLCHCSTAVAVREEVHEVLQGTGMPAAAAGGGGRGAAPAAGRGAGMMTAEQLAALDKADRRAAKKAEKKVRAACHTAVVQPARFRPFCNQHKMQHLWLGRRTVALHACVSCCSMSVPCVGLHVLNTTLHQK
jgi:hypothetical protein